MFKLTKGGWLYHAGKGSVMPAARTKTKPNMKTQQTSADLGNSNQIRIEHEKKRQLAKQASRKPNTKTKPYIVNPHAHIKISSEYDPTAGCRMSESGKIDEAIKATWPAKPDPQGHTCPATAGHSPLPEQGQLLESYSDLKAHAQRLADALRELARQIDRDNLSGRYSLTSSKDALAQYNEGK